MGLLGGKWVVGEGWAEACLAAGRPVGEEGFLVSSVG